MSDVTAFKEDGGFRVKLWREVRDPQSSQPAAPQPQTLRLQKPAAIFGSDQTWFAKFNEPASQCERNRRLFARPQPGRGR